MQKAPFASAAVEAVLRPRVESTLRAAMTSFQELFGSDHEEYKLTVLVCAEGARDATVKPSASTPEEVEQYTKRLSASNPLTLARSCCSSWHQATCLRTWRCCRHSAQDL